MHDALETELTGSPVGAEPQSLPTLRLPRKNLRAFALFSDFSDRRERFVRVRVDVDVDVD